MLSQSDDWMAQHTTFIQWMLPVAEHSMFTQRGPLLKRAEFASLSVDDRVRNGIGLSRDRVLRYLGLEQRNGELLKRPNWPAVEQWTKVPGSEDLRVSRMLRSLVLFGFVEESRELYRHLETLIRESRGTEAAEPTLAYWRAASYKDSGRP
jgi:hypothetical protein